MDKESRSARSARSARSSSINSGHKKPQVQALLDRDEHIQGSWDEFGSADGVWQLLVGFSNATQISFGQNRTDCQFALEAIADSSVFASQILVEKWFNYWNFLRAIDNYLIVTYNLHTVCFSCYYGVLELVDLFDDYIDFVHDIKILWFNWGYNMGGIITSIKNIWMWNVAKEYTRIEDAFTMGLEMGQIFWMMFYPTQKYLNQAIRDSDNEWGQDYSWDAVIFRKDIDPDVGLQPLTTVVQTALSLRLQAPHEEAEEALAEPEVTIEEQGQSMVE